MSKRTPGPWTLHEDGSIRDIDYNIVADLKGLPDDDALLIAAAHGITLPPASHLSVFAQLVTAAERDRLREVNAELLAALRGMLDIVAESRGVIGYHQNESEAEWGEFQQVDDARAAVAKAEGQS